MTASNVSIWHNPRCSKSRAALELLLQLGVTHTIFEYLKTPPDAVTIRDALARLNITPRELLRSGEAIYRELGLADPHSDDALIDAMSHHPILIERPIVFTDTGSAIGRPTEAIRALFD